MTICIGALTQIPTPTAPRIVLCSDSKVSNDWFSSETEYKFHRLSPQFVALASDSPSRAKELAQIYRDQIGGVELTVANALESLRAPVRELKRRIADSYVSRKMGVSYSDFLDKGQSWLGDEQFEKCRSTIEGNPIRVDMIIAGFIGKERMLFDLKDGEVQQVSHYSVIGSGTWMAEPVFHARKHTAHSPLSEAMYTCYEAKKMAQIGPYVGEKTNMLILSHGDEKSNGHIRAQVVTDKGLKFLDKQYRKYGPKPMKVWPIIPDGALQTAFFNFDDGY